MLNRIKQVDLCGAAFESLRYGLADAARAPGLSYLDAGFPSAELE